MSVKSRLAILEAKRKDEVAATGIQLPPMISPELWEWVYSNGKRPDILDDSAKPWLRNYIEGKSDDVKAWLNEP